MSKLEAVDPVHDPAAEYESKLLQSAQACQPSSTPFTLPPAILDQVRHYRSKEELRHYKQRSKRQRTGQLLHRLLKPRNQEHRTDLSLHRLRLQRLRPQLQLRKLSLRLRALPCTTLD